MIANITDPLLTLFQREDMAEQTTWVASAADLGTQDTLSGTQIDRKDISLSERSSLDALSYSGSDHRDTKSKVRALAV